MAIQSLFRPIRTRKRIEEQGLEFNPLVQLLKPLGFHDYNKLQKSAKAVLSDSGTISEESSIMNFPALNIREAHERPEAFEEASVMMVGLEVERVFQALQVLDSQPTGNERLLRPVADYSMPNVSDKIVRIVHSYLDYVMRWCGKQYCKTVQENRFFCTYENGWCCIENSNSFTQWFDPEPTFKGLLCENVG